MAQEHPHLLHTAGAPAGARPEGVEKLGMQACGFLCAQAAPAGEC